MYIENIDLELDALRNTWRYKKATDESKAKLEKDIRDEMASERKKAEEEANAQMKRQFLRDRALRASEAIINTARAVITSSLYLSKSKLLFWLFFCVIILFVFNHTINHFNCTCNFNILFFKHILLFL